MVRDNNRECMDVTQNIGADINNLQYGVSVTDACVGWDETVAMLEEVYNVV